MPCGVRAGLAALAILAVAAAPAAGQVGVSDPVQQSQAIDRQLSRYRQQYAEVSASEVDLLAQLDLARQAKDAADLELARLEATVQDTTAAVSAAQQVRDAAQQAAADAADHLTEARAVAGAARHLLEKQAVENYMAQGRFGVLTATVKHAGQEDALAAYYYASLAGGVQADRVTVAQASREAAAAAEESAARTRAAAVATEADLAVKQAAAQQARDAQAGAQQQAVAEVANTEQLLADLQRQKAAYTAQMDQLAAESRQIAAMLRQRAAATAPARSPTTTTAATAPTKAPPAATSAPKVPPATKAPTTKAPATNAPATTAPSQGPPSTYPQDYSTGPPPVSMSLTYPMPGWPVVSGFGMRVDPVLNVSRMHEGIDIWAPEGTPIRAAGSGTVIWAGDRHGYGNAVFIDHGSGVVTVYAHQSKVGVAVGQHVGTGDVIGYIGHTGLAAGPHLHFEVRVNGTAYNPLKFVSPR